MDVYFLEAGQPLTKRYTSTPAGIEAESYPHVLDFKSHKHTLNTLAGFERVLIDHAQRGHCLLKGQLLKELNFESRAGSTDSNALTEFLVLDIDGLPNHTPEEFMFRMNMTHLDYIVQYSASQGVLPKKGLSCHIFILLTKPTSPSQIKQWLIQKNLEEFDEYLTLTRSGVALHYPLDITACQNDKLIYIAPPICTPPSLDQFGRDRIKLVVKS